MIALSVANVAFAQQKSQANKFSNVTLHVRTVRATHTAELQQARAAVNELPGVKSFAGSGSRKGKKSGVHIDEKLRDLGRKLRQLPYKSYHMLSSQHVPVPVDQRQELSLSGGQVLKYRLIYVNKKKVGMWLRWEDRFGQELLDTRMHFSCSESMVTGTENSDNSGSILAVRVLTPDAKR